MRRPPRHSVGSIVRWRPSSSTTVRRPSGQARTCDRAASTEKTTGGAPELEPAVRHDDVAQGLEQVLGAAAGTMTPALEAALPRYGVRGPVHVDRLVDGSPQHRAAEQGRQGRPKVGQADALDGGDALRDGPGGLAEQLAVGGAERFFRFDLRGAQRLHRGERVILQLPLLGRDGRQQPGGLRDDPGRLGEPLGAHVRAEHGQGGLAEVEGGARHCVRRPQPVAEPLLQPGAEDPLGKNGGVRGRDQPRQDEPVGRDVDPRDRLTRRGQRWCRQPAARRQGQLQPGRHVAVEGQGGVAGREEPRPDLSEPPGREGLQGGSTEGARTRPAHPEALGEQGVEVEIGRAHV